MEEKKICKFFPNFFQILEFWSAFYSKTVVFKTNFSQKGLIGICSYWLHMWSRPSPSPPRAQIWWPFLSRVTPEKSKVCRCDQYQMWPLAARSVWAWPRPTWTWRVASCFTVTARYAETLDMNRIFVVVHMCWGWGKGDKPHTENIIKASKVRPICVAKSVA